MDTSSLTSIDTQRVLGLGRTGAPAWQYSPGKGTSDGNATDAAGAKSRQPGRQAFPQTFPRPAQNVGPSAVFLAQSLAQEGGGTGGNAASSPQAAADAYARPGTATASTATASTVEILPPRPQLASGRSVDLTI